MTPPAVALVATPSASERSSLGGTVGIVGTECQLDEAGLLAGIQVMEPDYRVGVCFAENVRVEGNVRLWADGFELEMTRQSRAFAAGPGGARALWFDRSEYPSAFYVLDWRRDPELGERVTLAASGEEIVYELPDLLIMRLTNEYVAPVSAPVYELRIEHASMATDRFVVGISGIEGRGERFTCKSAIPLDMTAAALTAGFSSLPRLPTSAFATARASAAI